MTTNPNFRGLAVGLLFLCLPGCRTVAELTGDRDAKPNGNIHWANSFGEEVDLMPSEDKRTVFLAPIRNSSGSDIDTARLEQSIRDGVTKRGWRLVKGPKEASYQLGVILHYWGENPNPDSGDWALKHAREALAVAGAVGAAATADNWRDFALRGAAGGLGGIVVGEVVKNHSRAKEWNMVLETRLEEHVDGEVTNTLDNARTVDAGSGNAAGAGDGGSFAGTTSERTKSTQEFRSIKNQYRHRNVLVGYARQIKMTEPEAISYLTPKLERALPAILP